MTLWCSCMNINGGFHLSQVTTTAARVLQLTMVALEPVARAPLTSVTTATV